MNKKFKNKIYESLKKSLSDLSSSISHDENELKEMRRNSQCSEVEEQAQKLEMESNFTSILNKKYSRVMNIN